MNSVVLQGLSEVLKTQHALTLVSLLYNCNDVVYVYKADSQLWGRCAVKIQRIFNPGQRKVLEAEGKNLQFLQNHRNIVEFKGWLEYNAGENQGDFIVIITELCDKDLITDITQRKAAGEYRYTEEEMWRYVGELVSVLAYLEEYGIAHRDVKPQNVFLVGKTVKLGDFGSATSIGANMTSYTAAGTPLYFSPLLKLAFLSGTSRLHHNIYKSDMYSLGLTFLAMCHLQEPVVSFNDTVIPYLIATIPYSCNLQHLLSFMLQPDESQRPTFKELYFLLNPVPSNPQDEEKSGGYEYSLPIGNNVIVGVEEEKCREGEEEIDLERQDRERDEEIRIEWMEEQQKTQKKEINPQKPGMKKAKSCCSVF